MFNRARKLRMERLERLVLQRIESDPGLVEEYRSRRWTRRRLKIERVMAWLIRWTICVFGIVILADLGLMLTGLQETLRLLLSGQLKASDPTLTLASWSLFTFAFMTQNAILIRNAPSDVRWGQLGFLVPIADSRVIGFWRRNVGWTVFAFAISGGVAFGVIGVLSEWSWSTWGRVVLMIVLTIVLACVMTESIVKILTPSRLVRGAVAWLLIISVFIGFAMCMASRDWVEMRQAVYFGPLWMLPPGGWLIGVSGLLEPDPLRDWIMPALSIIVIATAFRWLPKSLYFNHVQLLQNQLVHATRVGWVVEWQRTFTTNQIWTRFQAKPDQIVTAIQLFRKLFLPPKSPRLPRLLQLLMLSPRGYATLIIAHMEPSHVGDFRKYLQGYSSIILAVAILILNQFVPLAGVPTFIRLPLFIIPLLAIYRISNLRRNLNSGNELRQADLLFPYRLHEFVAFVIANQVARTVRALPAISVAFIVLMLTDLPASLILHSFGLAILVSFQLSLDWSMKTMATNLLTSWSWGIRILIPSLSGIVIAAMLNLQAIFAFRYDVAWSYGVGAVALSSSLAVYLCYAIESRFDVTAMPGTRRSFTF